jgi:hypothetical protein
MENNTGQISRQVDAAPRFPTSSEMRDWLRIAMPRVGTNATQLGLLIGGKNTISDFLKKPQGEIRLGTIGEAFNHIQDMAAKSEAVLPPVPGGMIQ